MTGRDISDRIKPSPTLGFFYTIQPGDTLLGVAGRASGTSPGSERLAVARTINDAAYNDRFRGAPNKLFPKGQVSFLPRFAEDPNAQAAQDGAAPAGHALATLWLASAPGDEPDLEPEPEPEPPPDPEPEPDPDEPPIPKPTRDFVDWEELHRGISVRADTTEYVFLRPEIIPIIIIPGISGSAIEPRVPRDRKRNGPGWPLNDIGQMLKILVRGARGKRKNLIGKSRHFPDYMQVIGGNDPNVDGNEAGLLGVAKMKYEPFVNRINERNAIRKDPNKGADAPLRHHYFRTPPHCFGYNWTADITISARALLDFVEKLGSYYAADRGRCERVILVTHSTGGLVARSALQQDPSFADRVVAVYHNGVPHVGAAEAYFRVKSGFPQGTPADKLVAMVTMRNGDEAGALLGNIPGGLQLLPSAAYRTNAGDVGWLAIDCGPDGCTRYPQVDPYTEIYTNPNHLWGLIDKELLDPRLSADPDEEFKHYKALITDVVMPLHKEIIGIEFPKAIQVVSTGLDTPDEIKLSATADEAVVNDFLAQVTSPPPRLNEGEYKIAGHLYESDPRLWYLELGPRAGDGDATVPTAVADGTHSGGPYKQIATSEAPHADMLMNVSIQWKILEHIEAQLEHLITSFTYSLRQRA